MTPCPSNKSLRDFGKSSTQKRLAWKHIDDDVVIEIKNDIIKKLQLYIGKFIQN